MFIIYAGRLTMAAAKLENNTTPDRLGKNTRNFGIDTLSLNLRENLGALSL
jgi:hypothetical protein